MDETRVLQRGTAWGSRALKDRTQTVSLRRGRFVLHGKSDELLEQEEGWTKIVVSESVLLGKKPPNDWPVSLNKNYKAPKLPDIGLSVLQKTPNYWNNQVTPVGASQFYVAFRDERKYEVIVAEFRDVLVKQLKWRVNPGLPSTSFRPSKSEQKRTGIIYIDLVPPGAQITQWEDGCTVRISFTDAIGSVDWKAPRAKILFRDFPAR